MGSIVSESCGFCGRVNDWLHSPQVWHLSAELLASRGLLAQHGRKALCLSCFVGVHDRTREDHPSWSLPKTCPGGFGYNHSSGSNNSAGPKNRPGVIRAALVTKNPPLSLGNCGARVVRIPVAFRFHFVGIDLENQISAAFCQRCCSSREVTVEADG